MYVSIEPCEDMMAWREQAFIAVVVVVVVMMPLYTHIHMGGRLTDYLLNIALLFYPTSTYHPPPPAASLSSVA